MTPHLNKWSVVPRIKIQSTEKLTVTYSYWSWSYCRWYTSLIVLLGHHVF